MSTENQITSIKPLKSLTLDHILQAFHVLAENKVRMSDSREDSIYRYGQNNDFEFSIKDGHYFYKNSFIKSILLDFGTKVVNFNFQTQEYRDFFKRNKYSINFDENRAETQAFLRLWQSELSKNQRKYISKVVNQFERTKSIEISERVLKLIPKVQFSDTGVFSKYILLKTILPSQKTLDRLAEQKEFKSAVDKVASLTKQLEEAKKHLESLVEKRSQEKLKNTPKLVV